MPARPIFVLGPQGSGAARIGNLLEAHPTVAAVTARRRQGLHESLFFSHFARAWNWRDPGARAKAIGAFLSSDYGQLMHLDPVERGIVDGAGAPAKTFAAAMDCLAWRQGATAWVERSPDHAGLRAADIAAALPEAGFVAVRCAAETLLAARLSGPGVPPRGPGRAWAILRGAVEAACHDRAVSRLAARYPHRVVRMEVETFHAGGGAAAADLLVRLKLAPAPGLAPRFAPETGFEAAMDRARALRPGEALLARAAGAVTAALPHAVLALGQALLDRRRVVFPAWVWADPAQRPREIAVAAPRDEPAAPLRAARS